MVGCDEHIYHSSRDRSPRLPSAACGTNDDMGDATPANRHKEAKSVVKRVSKLLLSGPTFRGATLFGGRKAAKLPSTVSGCPQMA